MQKNPISIQVAGMFCTFTLATKFKRSIVWQNTFSNGTYEKGTLVNVPSISGGSNKALIDTIHLSSGWKGAKNHVVPTIEKNIEIFDATRKGTTIYYPTIELVQYDGKGALLIGSFNASDKHKNQVLITNLDAIVRTGELICHGYLTKWLIGGKGFKINEIRAFLKIERLTVINFDSNISDAIGNANKAVQANQMELPNLI